MVTLGRRRGELLRRTTRRGNLFVDGRPATAAERRSYGTAFGRTDLSFAGAAREPADRPLASALPPLGRWRKATEATMALISGRPLREVSVQDFPSDEFGDNYFIRGGYGAYLARLASGLPAALGCPVHRVGWSGPGVTLDTAGGPVKARAVLVTVPVPVLAAGAIRFDPGLPDDVADALSAFLPGSYEHVVLNWPGSPFAGADRLTKLIGRRFDAALLTGMDRAPFHYLELDHATLSSLRGGAEVARFARDLLRDAFGARALGTLRVLHVTDWRHDPHSLCSWSVVPPGRTAARDVISRPLGDRVWFAGEASSRSLWGTAGGAWEEGERAAGEIAAALGAVPKPGETT